MTRYPSILLSPEPEEELSRNGYVILRQVIPREIIQSLHKYHELNKHLYPDTDQLINAFTQISDPAYRKNTLQLITDLLGPVCSSLFQNFQLLGGSFKIKPARGGALGLHTDGTHVDEKSFRFFRFWIPLCDVDDSNGPLYVIPQSHLLPLSYRGPGIPSTIQFTEEQVVRHLNVIPLRVGDAVLFDHRLIHGSFENKGDRERVAVGCSITTADIPLSIWKQDEAGRIQQRLITPIFFTEQTNWHRLDFTNYPLVAESDNTNAPVSIEQIEGLQVVSGLA